PGLLVVLRELALHRCVRYERFHTITPEEMKSEWSSDNSGNLAHFELESSLIERQHPTGTLEPAQVSPLARAPSIFGELHRQVREIPTFLQAILEPLDASESGAHFGGIGSCILKTRHNMADFDGPCGFCFNDAHNMIAEERTNRIRTYLTRWNGIDSIFEEGYQLSTRDEVVINVRCIHARPLRVLYRQAVEILPCF